MRLNETFATIGANVHLHLEQFDEAIEDSQKAIELDPNFTKVSVFPHTAIFLGVSPPRLFQFDPELNLINTGILQTRTGLL